MRLSARLSKPLGGAYTNAIHAFLVRPAGLGMRITCTVGPHPGFTRLVIRYRTDGVTPSTPTDGLALLDSAIAAGVTYRGRHHPRNRGLAYCYTAFGLTHRGSVRVSKTVCVWPEVG